MEQVGVVGFFPPGGHMTFIPLRLLPFKFMYSVTKFFTSIKAPLFFSCKYLVKGFFFPDGFWVGLPLFSLIQPSFPLILPGSENFAPPQ